MPAMPLTPKSIELIQAGKAAQAQAWIEKQQQEQGKPTIEAMILLAFCRIWQDDPLAAVAHLERAVKTSRDEAYKIYALTSKKLMPGYYYQTKFVKDSDEYWEAEHWDTKLDSLGDTLITHPEWVEGFIRRSDILRDVPWSKTIKPADIRDDFAICELTMAIMAAKEKEDYRLGEYHPDRPELYRLHPGRATCYSDRAHLWGLAALVRHAKYADAHISDLRHQMELMSEPDSVLPELAEALIYAGHFQEAKEMIPEDFSAIEGYEKHKWQTIKTDSLIIEKKHAEAIVLLTERIEEDETESEDGSQSSLRSGRADCYIAIGQYDKAMADVDRLLQADPEGYSYVWQTKYRAMLHQGKWEDVATAIKTEEGPANFPSAARRARVEYLMQLKRWDEAERDLKFLMGDDEETYWINERDLAIIYQGQGKQELAQQHIRRAQKLYEAEPLLSRFPEPRPTLKNSIQP